MNILFITFYIKKEKIKSIQESLNKYASVKLIEDYDDFKKYREINFDVVLTALYWKINWADHFEKKKFDKKIPDFIKYKLIIYQESNPLSSYGFQSKNFLYRYSFGNICLEKQKNIIDKDIIKKRDIYKIEIKPYKKPEPQLAILILLQNYFNHFLNMKLEEYEKYIQNIINEIRKYSNNKIIVRYKYIEKENDHRKYSIKLNDPNNNMIFTGSNPLDEDIKNSYIAIAHSTNAVVKIIFEGVHLISLSKFCLCDQFANKDIKDIVNPKEFDRELLYNKLLSCSWSFEDFNNNNFLNYVNKHLLLNK